MHRSIGTRLLYGTAEYLSYYITDHRRTDYVDLYSQVLFLQDHDGMLLQSDSTYKSEVKYTVK